jgi:hypothetical protein
MREANEKKIFMRPNLLIFSITFFLLIITGIVYRTAVSKMNNMVNTPVSLPVPLGNVPQQIGNWAGEDISIDEITKEIAGNDDYLSRVYINRQNKQSASIYLGYSARPRNMMGHNPEVCYRANGWISDGFKNKQFLTSRGRSISCLIYKFHRITPEIKDTFVLNFYIINGQTIANQGDFGLGLRMPNIDGDPARYAARIQISSPSEKNVIDLAQDITDVLLDYLPDVNGSVFTLKSGSEVTAQHK